MFNNATIVGSLITALLVFLGSLLVPLMTKRLNKVSEAVEVADRLSANAEKNSDIALRIAETVDKKLGETEKKLDTTKKRCDECLVELDTANRRAQRLERSNSALIDAFTELLPLLPQDAKHTVVLRAAIRTARQARYETNG